jgi:hypothetical protein
MRKSSAKEPIEITFKKNPNDNPSPENAVKNFEIKEEDNIEDTNSEFKEDEIDESIESKSIISSNVMSRIGQMPHSNTMRMTENSFCSNYTRSESGSRLDSINPFPTVYSRNTFEAEMEITNENSDGFTNFISTPKSKNLITNSNIRYHSNLNVFNI